MNDETYAFISDVKSKRATARSARNRRTHNGKSGRVKFPSDYMTKKEINAMNGEVKSYRLNEPMSWNEFKAMPDDIKVTYIKLLREKFRVSDTNIGKMMGAAQSSVQKEFVRLGCTLGKGKFMRNFDEEGWVAWCNGVPVKQEEPVPVVEEEAEEPVTEESAENIECGVLNYAAAYEEAMHELEKAKAEICYMRDELRLKKEEAMWLNGFKAAVEVIFGKEN